MFTADDDSISPSNIVYFSALCEQKSPYEQASRVCH